jgi:hypothetical protein
MEKIRKKVIFFFIIQKFEIITKIINTGTNWLKLVSEIIKKRNDNKKKEVFFL